MVQPKRKKDKETFVENSLFTIILTSPRFRSVGSFHPWSNLKASAIYSYSWRKDLEGPKLEKTGRRRQGCVFRSLGYHLSYLCRCCWSVLTSHASEILGFWPQWGEMLRDPGMTLWPRNEPLGEQSAGGNLLRQIRQIRIQTYGEGNGNPLQYSCLDKSMDRGAWQAAVHGVTWLSMCVRGWREMGW